MTRSPMSMYRWRVLTPAQHQAVRRSYVAGVRAADLAAAYGVGVRSIYRAIRRAPLPRRTVWLGHWRSEFEITEDGPIQVVPWTPA